nr:hypothetical protein [Tanacetum cinerariifolium]
MGSRQRTYGRHKDDQARTQVLMNLNNARDLLTNFDECIKRKTTLSPYQIGSWEHSDIKEIKELKYIFKQMEDDVDLCSMIKKSFEIEKKQLLINNDRLLEENIASDIMCTYLCSLNEIDTYGKCKSLDIVPLDLQESNKSLGHPNTIEYTYSDESDKDEPSEVDKSEIDPLRESIDTFLMRDGEIELNSHEDIDDLVLIEIVSEKPLDSRDPISKTFNMTITNHLFDFHSEFILNSDNPIFDIHNEESDESEMETIMKEV